MFELGRLLTALATAAAVLIGAALGVPALMGWEHLRAPAEARAQALLGQPVRIDGRISVQLLPAPRLSLGNVVLERAEGRAVSGAIARVRVHLSPARLLAGEAAPVALSLSGADLLIDRAAARRSNLLPPLPLTVTESSLRFEFGGEPEITGLALQVETDGENGDRRVRASGVFSGARFAIRGVLRGDGALRSATLDFGEGEAGAFMTRAGEGFDLGLKLRRGEKGLAFLGHVLPELAQIVRPEQAARLGPLALKLHAAPEGGAFVLRNIEITAGPVQLTGGGRFRPGARPGLDLELGARTLLLGGGASGFDPSGPLRLLGQAAEWGGAVDGGLRLHADHIVAFGTAMRGGEIRLAFGQGGARLQRLRLALPGGLALTGRGLAAAPGRIAAAIRLEAAERQAPPGRAGATPPMAQGRLVLSGARALLQGVKVTAEGNSVEAEAALYFGEKPSFELRAEADELDLRAAGLARDKLLSDLSVHGIWMQLRRLAAAADLTARIELGAVRLTDATLRDAVLDFALDHGQAVLRRLSVSEEGGRTVEARLRAPLAPSAAEGDGEAQGWLSRAEAALEVRPAQPGSHGLSWRASLWDGVLSLETDGPLRSRLAGRLSLRDGLPHWIDVRGRVGKAPVSGDVFLVPQPALTAHAKIHVERAAFTFEGDTDESLWPTFGLAGYWPRAPRLVLDWSAGELTVAGVRLSGASGKARLDGDTARLVLLSGTLFGGAASGMATLRLTPDGTAEWESEGVVQRADLARLMGGGWQGRGLLRQSTSGSGASIGEIVAGLRGTVGVSFDEGRIGGLDAAALAASLSRRGGADANAAALEQALASGSTPFRRLEGEARIRDGEITLSGIGARTDAGPVMLSGVVSLPARLIAAQADIALAGAAPLSLRFIGPMEAPERMVVRDHATAKPE